MKRGNKRPESMQVPPDTMAKMLEVAAMFLLADALRAAARQGRSVVISFPKGEPPVGTFVSETEGP